MKCDGPHLGAESRNARSRPGRVPLEGVVATLGIPEVTLIAAVVLAISVLTAWASAPVADYLVRADEPIVWRRLGTLLIRRHGGGTVATTVTLSGIIAVGLGVVAWRVPAAAWPAFGILVVALAVLAVIDWRKHRLPDVILAWTYPATLLGLLGASFATDSIERMLAALLGAAVGVGLYGFFYLVHPPGLGLGDVKLSGLLGLALGWLGLGEFTLGMTSAFLFGGLYSMLLLIARKLGIKDSVPLGPWMVAGTFLGIAFGSNLVS